MDKIYTSDYGLREMSEILRIRLGNKVFYEDGFKINNQKMIFGSYLDRCTEKFDENALPALFLPKLMFTYEFINDKSLRITIRSKHENSFGKKLAALSDFYEIISDYFGEPTVFYTLKNDDERGLNLQWSLVNKEEDIQNFKNGNYFDSNGTDTLILIGEPKQECDFHNSKIAKSYISKKVGIPYELFGLIDEDYIKYKECKEIRLDGRIEGTPAVRKLAQKNKQVN